jgi:hypothetical protein
MPRRVRHARGLRQSDVGALHEAVDLLVRGEQPLATAAAQEDLGSALARRGETDDDLAFLEAAYDAYLAANAARPGPGPRYLHTLGSASTSERGPAAARLGQPDQRREGVVRVVAEGLTSREAAAQRSRCGLITTFSSTNASATPTAALPVMSD